MNLHEAHVLAAEHYPACPDWFHNNFDDWEGTYPAEFLTSRQWRFWWDGDRATGRTALHQPLTRVDG
ncbi:DUF4253 domain-containing protein [Streptomyces sp. NPDC049541]|uniref:DUF4253 domain-containing protein n=1 Tax=Streptomyces sp. NPDC049541 TaxID=3365594 RepID=UPI0037AFFC17